MTERTYGEKHNNKLGVKDIAKMMRAEIKNSIKAGTIPKGTKVSVRIERYSMGQSINISLTEFPIQFLNIWRVKFMKDYSNRCLQDIPESHPAREMYTPIASRTLAELKRIHGLWNHNGSDTMTDYFDVNYYGDASFGWELDSKQSKELKEKTDDIKWPSTWENYFNY